MTAREHILAFMQANPGERRTTEIAADHEGPVQSVYVALSDLVKRGELTRVRTGVYVLADGTVPALAETKPPARETKPARRASRLQKGETRKRGNGVPPPDLPEEPTEDEIVIAAWSNGAASIQSGEVIVNLSADQVQQLIRMVGAA